MFKTGFSEIRIVRSDWLSYSIMITRTELQLQSKCHENNSTKAPVNYYRKFINTHLNNFVNVKLMGKNKIWF